MVTCLSCQEHFSIPGNFSNVSDSGSCTLTCPNCGQKHDCDLRNETLTLPLTFVQRLLWGGGIIAVVFLFGIVLKVLGLI